MRIQTIVALTDFSTEAEYALDRAALLAAEHKARLHILFGAEELDPKFVDPQARLEQRARQLARRHGLPVKALPYRGGDVARETLRAAAEADLLVLDRRLYRLMGGLLRGGTLAQILRRSPCPVLVVQQAAHEPYAHALVAVDFSPTSHALARFVSALEPQAAVELFHTVPGRGDASTHAARAFRHEVRRDVQNPRVRLSDVFHARRNRVDMAVGTGDKARQIAVQQERSGAELVALGKRRRWALVDALRGSAARRLLMNVDCDVLVFPLDTQAGPAPLVPLASRPQPRVAQRWTQAT